MKEFDKFKDFDPVKIPVCEGVMGQVIRSKKKKWVIFGHGPARRDIHSVFRYQGKR